MEIKPGYTVLYCTLIDAFERAQSGKGSERHSRGGDFKDQYLLRGTRTFGIGGIQYQIGKKIEEIDSISDIDGKIGELLDVIIYAAGGVMYLREMKVLNESEKETCKQTCGGSGPTDRL